MLILGTCNPPGEGDQYNGLYLKSNEIQQVVDNREMIDIPVKTEHSGQDIGKVVSTFLNDEGKLQCLMEIDEANLNGSLAAGFVRDNIASDLSLGYSVDVKNSGNNKLKAGQKRVLEVSLVRKGAREGCHILAYQDKGKDVVHVKQQEETASCWDTYFSLPQ